MPIPGNLMTTAMAVMPHTDAEQAIKSALLFWDQRRCFGSFQLTDSGSNLSFIFLILLFLPLLCSPDRTVSCARRRPVLCLSVC